MTSPLLCPLHLWAQADLAETMRRCTDLDAALAEATAARDRDVSALTLKAWAPGPPTTLPRPACPTALLTPPPQSWAVVVAVAGPAASLKSSSPCARA